MWRKVFIGGAFLGLGIALFRAPRRLISIRGKVVLITGASSGIGRVTALALAREGAHLALIARRADRLNELVAGIAQTYPEVRAIAIPADLTVDDQARAAVHRTIQNFGRIDILINNAGSAMAGALSDYDPADIRKTIDLNLTATIRLTQLILPIMIQQQSGHMVIMSSTAGVLLAPGFSVYGTTKAALMAFSEILRRELDQTGIAVSIIMPTWTRTEMVDGMDEAEMKRAGVINILAGNFLEPELIAQQIVNMIRHRTERIMLGSPLYNILYGIQIRLLPHLADLIFRLYFRRYDRKSFMRAVKRLG